MKAVKWKINIGFYFFAFNTFHKTVCKDFASGGVLTFDSESVTTPLNNVIQNAILYSRTLHSLNPFTIRLVNECPETISESFNHEIWNICEEYPKIMGYAPGTNFSKRLEPDIRKAMTLAEGAFQMSAFFTIIFAHNPFQFSKLSNYIKQTVNPKLDFTLFILPTKQSKFHHQLISKFKIYNFPLLHKLIIILKIDNILTSPSIWIECLENCYLNKFSQSLQVPEFPLKNPRMGYNLWGRHLLISASESPPYTYVSEPSNNSDPEFKGVYVNLHPSILISLTSLKTTVLVMARNFQMEHGLENTLEFTIPTLVTILLYFFRITIY